MILTEFYKTREDGVKLYRSYSSKGLKIKQVQTGAIYDDAIDVEDATYTYVETDELVEVAEEQTEE